MIAIAMVAAAVSGYAGLLLSFHYQPCRRARRSSCVAAALYARVGAVRTGRRLDPADRCRAAISKRELTEVIDADTPISLAASLALLMPSPALAQTAPVKVVATFLDPRPISCAMSAATASRSPAWSRPDGDAHVYAPTPADAKHAVGRATGARQRPRLRRLDRAPRQILRHQGADRDGEQRRQAAQVAADSHGHGRPKPIRMPGSRSPMPRLYVGNIRDAPDHGRSGQAGGSTRPMRTAYLAKLDALDARGKRRGRENPGRAPHGASPPTTRSAISGPPTASSFIAPAGRLDRVRSRRRKDVARIITQINKQKIPAVFLENVSDPRLMQRISAEEPGAKVGGTLYSDAPDRTKRARPPPTLTWSGTI